MSQSLRNLFRALKNILKVNQLRILNRFNFPVCILPSVRYKLKIDFNSLTASSDIFISRRFDKSKQDTFNTLGKIRDDAFIIKDVPSMSLNLHGGKFKPEHVSVKTKNNGRLRWERLEPVYISEYLNDYEIIASEFSVGFFSATKIHETQIPYQHPHSPELKREADRFFNMVHIPVNKEHTFTAEVKLVHDPTYLNYWHVELKISNFKGEMKGRQKYFENLCEHIINNVLVANSSEIYVENRINRVLYTRKTA